MSQKYSKSRKNSLPNTRSRQFAYLFVLLFIAFLSILVLRTLTYKPCTPSSALLPLGVSDYPQNWYLASTSDDNPWHSDIAFEAQFANRTNYLASFVTVIKFTHLIEAQEAYTLYYSTAFWPPGPLSLTNWSKPSDLEIDLVNTRMARVACIVQSVEICTYWAVYDTCLLKLVSQIDDEMFTYQNFGVIVQRAGKELENNAYCKL